MYEANFILLIIRLSQNVPFFYKRVLYINVSLYKHET